MSATLQVHEISRINECYLTLLRGTIVVRHLADGRRHGGKSKLTPLMNEQCCCFVLLPQTELRTDDYNLLKDKKYFDERFIID